MKKLTSLLCILLSVLLLLTIVSCKNDSGEEEESGEEKFVPQTAIELWEKIDETMTNTDRWEETDTMAVDLNMNGYRIQMSMEGFIINYDTEDEVYYYRYGKTEMKCAELSLEETTEAVEAYYNGKAYISNIGEDITQKLCSEMTAEKFFETSDTLDDIDMTDCTTAEFSAKDDGSYELNFSGYTKKTVASFLKELDLSNIEQYNEIVDMEISVTADEKFRALKMGFSLVFESDDALQTPVFNVTTEYSKFGEAEPNYEEIKIEEYTEVDDISVLEDAEDSLFEIPNATSGKFTVQIDQKFSVDGQKETSSEKDTVSYGVQNGAFYLDLTSKQGGVTTKIAYKNGTMTITQGDQSDSGPVSDEVAKSYVTQLLNMSRFDSKLVTDIEKTGDGVYKFSLSDGNISVYESALEGIDAQIDSMKQETVITFSDEKIVKIEDIVEIEGSCKIMGAKKPLTMTVKSVVVIEEAEKSGIIL